VSLGAPYQAAIQHVWRGETRGTTMSNTGTHAIVIGASMGGLLAARALHNHFQSVTVLERDALPIEDIPRKGVPQGRHAHGLLAQGRNVIEGFFPGWTNEVVTAGGLFGDIANDVHWIGHGVRLKAAPSQLSGLLASRPVLEGHVRRRLAALPGVRLLDRCTVQSLLTEGEVVSGVRMDIEGRSQELAVDLVIDATGRGSSCPAWLKLLGFDAPSEDRIEIGAGYTTRLYRRRPTDLRGKLAVVVAGSAPNWRNGVVLAQSKDRWIVSIGGYLGDHAPTDEQMFSAYAASMSAPEIHEVVTSAEPVSDFLTYRFPASQRCRYERLSRFPRGFLVFGDAICSFNPVYGQGMTVAAQEAVVLNDCLRRGLDELAPRFFKAAATVVDVPWDIAVGNDLRHPAVEGPRPAFVRFINWYIGKLHMAAQHDEQLTQAFLTVANLVASPTTLLSPAVAWRVLRGALAGSAGPTSGPIWAKPF
jgi:2-polyprenyl-6-methoxyphenol hydroxylase-like FAD-dependent oxidoreductase